MIHWTQDGEKIEIPRAEAAQEGQLCELGGEYYLHWFIGNKVGFKFFFL